MQHNTALVDVVISFQHTSTSIFGLYSSGSGDLVIFILERSGSLLGISNYVHMFVGKWNFPVYRINWDIMRNATNSKIRVSVSHWTQKVYCERAMRWATNRSSLKSIGHWVQCWSSWVLSGTVEQMGSSGTNPTLWIASIVYDLMWNKNHGKSESFQLID